MAESPFFPGEVFDSHHWWAALRLAERRDPAGRFGRTCRPRGVARLAAWRTERTVTGGLAPDLSRWHDGGVSEEDLLLVLGETTESLRERRPEPPSWLGTLREAWSVEPPPDPAHDFDQHHHHLGPVADLLVATRPLRHLFQRRLHADLTRLATTACKADVVSIDHPLLRPHLETLLEMTLSVLVAEMHAARVRGELTGDTSAARFEDFTRRLGEPEFALRLLARHPTLARELVEELETWLAVGRELAEHLLADLPVLRAEFGLTGRGLADLVAVETGAGDTHREGRSVAILGFADGTRLVYKPRALAVEHHFYRLVGWLNQKLTHPLRQLRVVDRGGHGYVEFVRQEGCSDETAVSRFFHRQGTLLALLYLLRGSDVHLENVIAAGDQPVVIDLEAIFQQPQPTTRPARVPAPPEALQVFDDSVLTIGLLPQRLMRKDGDKVRAIELSGLAGAAGELTPTAVPRWHDEGTDRMHRKRMPVPMPGADNLPTLGGAPVAPTRHRDDLIAGFSAAYRLLLAHRDEILAPDGPIDAFAEDEIRFIALPTNTYARLLQESWHPAVLGDALDRDCLFEVLAGRHPDLAHNRAVLNSECRQIRRRDVPFFHTRPNTPHLYDDAGLVAADFFPRTGLDLVRERAAGLSEEDLGRQVWVIEASMAALDIGVERQDEQPRRAPLPSDPIRAAEGLEAAGRLGDALLGESVGDAPDRPVWLTLTLVADQYWTVAPSGFESFSGACGIALFLAQLAAQSPEVGNSPTRFRTAAQAIAGQLVDHVTDLSTWADPDRDRLGIGAFAELGSYIYTLVQLGVLWREPTLLDHAHRLVPELRRRIASDRALDVISGTAGGALSLRALHAIDPRDETYDALCAAGHRLLATADRQHDGLAWPTVLEARSPLLGFSHGVAGIAYALSEIARYTRQESFLTAALDAVRYEDRQYDPTAENWPDHRESTPVGRFMNAWCHGAAGIGLARAGILDHHDAPGVRAGMATAVQAVRKEILDGDMLTGAGNDSLCHGDLGLAETLLSAGLAAGDAELVGLARRVGSHVAHTVLAGRHECGVPHGVRVPGLLMGTAGIGYGLLRLADPARVPNVLLQSPPVLGPPEDQPAGRLITAREEIACPEFR